MYGNNKHHNPPREGRREITWREESQLNVNCILLPKKKSEANISLVIFDIFQCWVYGFVIT